MDLSIEYLEKLPKSCPPSEAVDQEHISAWRFVPTADATDIKLEHFLSQAALGINRPGTDPCLLAACSLFISRECDGFKKAKLLPRFRTQHFAELTIPIGAGMSLKNDKGHISLWMYKTFLPQNHLSQVVSNDPS